MDKWTKGCIVPFPMKGLLRLAKNYWGITLTSIVAKIYNALQRNHIEPKIENIFRKNQSGFQRNRSMTSQMLTIRRILEGVKKGGKKIRGSNIICRLHQGLWLHTQRENGANTTRLRPTQRNTDAIWKQESKSLFIRWRHRLLWHCCRCAARRHISRIPLYHLSGLRA